MNKVKALSFITTLLASLIVGAFAGQVYLSRGTEAAALKIDELETENQELLERNARLQFVSDLAAEFSINPRIVELVYDFSLQYVDASEPEWRLIQTPEFMTHIMLSVIHAESRGRAAAVGDSGRARGLTQIWVSTARQYGDVGPADLLDPETNLNYSFQHFHYLLKRYRGNLALTLYAWNRGPGKVDKLISYGQPPSNGYGAKVYNASLAAGRATGD